jgi:uncharacterized membrane protein YoaK (UPF0700 family)
MISKLPRWVWFGGAVLALIAGMINAVGFLGFQHQGVTHLTGTTTLLGVAIAQGDRSGMLHLAAVVGSFLTGAVLGGFLIQNGELKLGRRYGMALLVESVLLLIAVPLLSRQMLLGDYLASCACGLQNGMVSTYSGAVLRTTHVTGIFTDLGIFIGQIIRGIPVDRRRILLGLLLVSSFFGGGVAGALAFSSFSYGALYFPAALTGVVGFAYGFYRHLQRASPVLKKEALT